MLIGEKKIERPIRLGFVGGGRTGQVGFKHHAGAMYLNTAFKLVCGAFDVDPVRNVEFGTNLGVDKDRLYPDYKTMIAEEAKREDGNSILHLYKLLQLLHV